ncbi:Uncharacterised protein [Mycobacteroides abscessus subsp. abscessus]|nr:Uncharacterised protein [Mycobacteroides abscessus subsp. abscessus]
MTPAAMSFGIDSGSIMSCRASYSGRRYGSIFSLRVPGRKPSRSPASTAGRVRMMRLTALPCSAWTALAIARYVLPVPAGPSPNTMVLLSMASTYFFWLSVLGRIVFPRREMMSSDSTSAGDSDDPSLNIDTLCRTRSGVSGVPRPTRSTSSATTLSDAATSAC